MPVRSEEPEPEIRNSLLALARQILDRQRHRRRDAISDDIDIPVVDPVAHDADGDVRLVLMIGGNDLDAATVPPMARNVTRFFRGKKVLVGEEGLEPSKS